MTVENVTAREEAALDGALEVVRMLARDIGPRRPCSLAEEHAATSLRDWLRRRAVAADIEVFRGYASFAYPYGLLLAASFAGGLLARRGRRAGDGLAIAALLGLAAEGDLRFTPLSNALSVRESRNLVASIPARGQELARVCLCGHLDTTRSGLIFHPRLQRLLPALLALPAVSAVAVAAAPVLRRLRHGDRAVRASLAGLGLSLSLLAERELRGEDVAGANDNASGAAVAAQLAAEVAVAPLEHARVDLLVTGCEESGLLGAQAYLRADRERVRRTVFLNFDTVGGDAPLTYVMREGGTLTRPASPRLVAMLDEIARRRPELGLRRGRRTAGLPTDATAALVHGGEAVTLLARGDTIPNYHWPTDVYESIAPATVGRALEAGRELLRALDEGRDEGRTVAAH